MDQPTSDGLNSYWISRLAAEAGFKVAISGQGGDELFGGYTSLAWFERFERVARWARFLPARPAGGPGSHSGLLSDRFSLPFRWRKLSYLVGSRDPFVASQLAVKAVYLESDLRRLLPQGLAANGPLSEAERHLGCWAERVAHRELKERLAFMDLQTHLQPRLLRDMDAMSMANSLEVRPVFLDHCLVEFLLSVPAAVRMQQKRLLLAATKSFLPGRLHQDLLRRKKRTFTFPFARWLTRDLRETLAETFSPERINRVGALDSAAVGELWQRYTRSPAAVGWSRIWCLFVLQRWCETLGVRP